MCMSMMMDGASGSKLGVMNRIRGIRKETTSQESEGLLSSTLKEDRKSTVDPAAKIAAVGHPSRIILRFSKSRGQNLG
jgi:hypothetical protein